MTWEKFWSIIDRVRAKADMQDEASVKQFLYTELIKLPQDELLGFDCAWQSYRNKANFPKMVAAACIINDGSSDDRFTDFRNWLIMQGYDAYRQALIDPDNLAALNIPFRDTEWMGCGNVAWYAYAGQKLHTYFEKEGIAAKLFRKYPALLKSSADLHQAIMQEQLAPHRAPENEWERQMLRTEVKHYIDTSGLAYSYPDGFGEAYPLTGLMYCADCGGKMYVHRTYNGKRVPQYTCGQYGKYPIGSLCPTQHRIKAEAVLTLIADMLRTIAEYSRNDRAEFIRTVQETQAAQQTADISKKRKRLAAAQKRAGELERLICKIYEDNALGKLPDARYEALDAQYAKEQDALNAEITELEKAVTGYEQSRKSAEKFIALIDKYENFDTLTNIMLNEFVEKILVHERARKGSQDTTQEVEIYFNFVGRYIPPALQPVPLTPEEQEELRKKEERKDRLHQNYLRRKANGKQKEWEERYNAKRKAKMEAAKAAIRAENMEKGIFTTVSQLPKQEPRKATVSASAAV